MSRYTLPELLKMWERADLSNEQAIGQLLLHLQALSERVGQLERVKVEEARRDSSTAPPTRP